MSEEEFLNLNIKSVILNRWKNKLNYPLNLKDLEELENIIDYYEEMNQELKKQLEEMDKWLIVCISELMEEYKKDTFWITNQQIESTKNKNISYEVYGDNDIKFYQNIKK